MSAKPVILVTGADLAPQAVALLADYEMVYAGPTPGPDELLRLARQHNPTAIIVRFGGVTPVIMDAAPALKVISKHGSGTDTIDKQAAAERNIKVVAAVGSNAAAVAEQALALTLACAKSVVKLHERMQAGHWDKATHKNVELNGKTIGLIGLGAIGQKFARMVDALDMRVLGFDPYAKDLPHYVQPTDLNTIWRESDVLSFHCPLTADNRNMLNAQTLAQCKEGVIVVNTARGGLIDEPALLAAVQSGQVAMAGLDSFAIEPLAVPHVFRNQERIILSPHIGGTTSDAVVSMGVAAARNILAAMND